MPAVLSLANEQAGAGGSADGEGATTNPPVDEVGVDMCDDDSAPVQAKAPAEGPLRWHDMSDTMRDAPGAATIDGMVLR